MESRRNLFPFKSYFYFRFPLPVSWPTFAFPMSADVGQCRRRHIPVGHRRKCGGSRWNRVEICFRSKVISTSGFHFRFRGRHLRFPCRPMSGNVGGVIFRSGIAENVGVAVGIASKSVSVQKLFPLPVSTSGFVADICVSHVGRCRAMSAASYSGRASPKMWG